jgi:hypothetical protein
MAEELGKIEKPAVEDFKKGRKLFFVPLIYRTEDSPEEYLAIFTRYWEQVAAQINELSTKLGKIKRVYHELVAAAGDEGYKAIEGLSENSHRIALSCREKQAELEALEDSDILTEFMDWSRCLFIGLQNPKVVTKVYEAYQEAARKRTEQIAAKINETLKANEIGLLLMREGHQVQFPPDIQLFYVAPPALDELKRWLREQERAPGETDTSAPDG